MKDFKSMIPFDKTKEEDRVKRHQPQYVNNTTKLKKLTGSKSHQYSGRDFQRSICNCVGTKSGSIPVVKQVL